MGISQKYIDDLPQYDVFERMNNFGRKVLIAHGTVDSVVDICYSRKLVKYFKKASLTEYQGEGHGFSASARENWKNKFTRFVMEN